MGFADDAFGRVRVIDEWNASWPLPRTPRPLVERILEDEGLRARYRAYAAEYLERHFHPDRVDERLEDLWAVASIALEGDPYPPRRVTNPEDVGWRQILDSMKAFSRNRYRTARAQLANPLAEPPVHRETPRRRGPSPGPPSEDAPSGLRATIVEPRNVVLVWTDNADGEVFHAVQRCSGPDCTDFVNHVGTEGENVVTLTDTAAQSGRTYRYRVYAVHRTPRGPRGTGVSEVIEVTVP